MAREVTRRRKLPRTSEQISSVLARRQLNRAQRLAVHALVMTTTRAEALALLAVNNIGIDKATLSRWMTHAAFREAIVAAERAVAESINRNSILRKSEAALEVAMKGTPVLGYVGKDEQEIVGYKPDLPSAARLIEIQGRAVNAFGDDGATKIAILVDVDFSGRKDVPVIDAEIIEPTDSAENTGAGLALDEPEPEEVDLLAEARAQRKAAFDARGKALLAALEGDSSWLG